MELNQINNSQIVQNQQLEQTSLNQLSKTKKNIIQESDSSDALSLNLSTNATKPQRSSYASEITKLNDGLAISQIATNGLEKQGELLNQVKDLLNKKVSQTMDEIQKSELKTDIKSFLDSFNAISSDTKYQGQNLLKQDYEDQKVELNIGNDAYSIMVPDTSKIGAELASLTQKNTFTPQDTETLKTQVDDASSKIKSFLEDFSIVKDNVLESAKETLNLDANSIKNNQKSQEVNFGRESNDFTKTNLTSQMGYLLASQANANQESNIKLLAV